MLSEVIHHTKKINYKKKILNLLLYKIGCYIFCRRVNRLRDIGIFQDGGVSSASPNARFYT